MSLDQPSARTAPAKKMMMTTNWLMMPTAARRGLFTHVSSTAAVSSVATVMTVQMPIPAQGVLAGQKRLLVVERGRFDSVAMYLWLGQGRAVAGVVVVRMVMTMVTTTTMTPPGAGYLGCCYGAGRLCYG
jgi:hypothetical protein